MADFSANSTTAGGDRDVVCVFMKPGRLGLKLSKTAPGIPESNFFAAQVCAINPQSLASEQSVPSGSVIIAINGESAKGKAYNEIMDLVKKAASVRPVTLVFRRTGRVEANHESQKTSLSGGTKNYAQKPVPSAPSQATTLQATVDDLRLQLATQRSEYQRKLEELETDLKSSEERFRAAVRSKYESETKHKAALDNCEVRFATALEERNAARASLEAMNVKIAAAEKVAEDTAEKLQAAHKTNSDFERKINVLQNECTHAVDREEELRKSAESSEATIEALKSQLMEFRRKNQELENIIAKETEIKEKVEESLTEARQQANELRAAKSGDFAAQAEALDQKHRELEEAKAKISTLETQYDLAQEMIGILRESALEVENIRSSSQNNCKEIENLREKLSLASKSCEELSEEVTKLHAEKDSLSAELNAKLEEASKNEAEMATMNQNLQEAKQRQDAVLAQKSELRDKVRRLQEDLSKANQRATHTMGMAKEAARKAADQQLFDGHELKKARDHADKLKREVDAALESSKELRALLDAAEERNSELVAARKRDKNKMLAMEDVLKSKVDSIQATEKKLSEHASLKAEFEELQVAGKVSAQQNEQLREEIANLTQSLEKTVERFDEAKRKADLAESRLQEMSSSKEYRENEATVALRQEIDDAQKEIKLLRSGSEVIHTDLARATEEIMMLQRENAKLSDIAAKSKASRDKEKLAAQEVATLLQQQVEKARKQVEELLAAQVADAKGRADAEASAAEAQRCLAELQKQRNAQDEKCRSLQRECETSREQLQQEAGRTALLQQALNNYKALEKKTAVPKVGVQPGRKTTADDTENGLLSALRAEAKMKSVQVDHLAAIVTALTRAKQNMQKDLSDQIETLKKQLFEKNVESKVEISTRRPETRAKPPPTSSNRGRSSYSQRFNRAKNRRHRSLSPSAELSRHKLNRKTTTPRRSSPMKSPDDFMDLESLLEQERKPLAAIFKFYAAKRIIRKIRPPESVKGDSPLRRPVMLMTMRDLLRFCFAFRIVPDLLAKQQIQEIYSYVLESHMNACREDLREEGLSFACFLVALGRIAVVCSLWPEAQCTPRHQVFALLQWLERSGGKKKMAQGRSTTVVQPFRSTVTPRTARRVGKYIL